MKASDLLVKCLEEEGIEYIFGVPGESISPVQYAVKNTPIEIITTRHEQAAAFMAEAYGRLTGKAGVVLVTFGPGFTNTLSAIVHFFDELIINGFFVGGLSRGAASIGSLCRKVQSGKLQAYAFAVGLGVILVVYFTVYY